MHINNVSAKTSIKFILIFTLFAGLYTAGTILAYIYLSADVQKTISGFFSWALASLSSQESIADVLLLISLPVIFYTGLIIAIVQRYLGLKKLASSLNLKSVDFLPDRVKFNFNRPQYNFVCGYGEIKNLEMILNTTLVYTKGGRMIVLNEIELDFTVLNNKSFSLKNTPVRPMNFIYKIIDYGKMVNHFSYKFEGAGTQPDINEKIEDYLQTGVVSILTSAAEGPVKWFSVLFFIIGLVFLIAFKDDINYFLTKDFTGLLLPGLPVAAFIGVSFIFDIILIVDKIQEKICKGYNGR